jgi:heme/copper-type cytochrome/quinol oxidase subunit 2
MKGWVFVHSPEDYDKWIAENVNAGAAPAGGKSAGAGTLVTAQAAAPEKGTK